MLADWYFGCCINANPKNIKILLSISDILDDPESDGYLLYLTYEELLRTDIWMQIYLLPQVLKSLRCENVPINIQRVVDPYFDELIAMLPEVKGVKPAFRKLVDSVVLGETAAAVKACSLAIMDLPSRDVSWTPYLDLKDFLPETLLLAVIADQIVHDQSGGVELSSLGKETPEVDLVLQNAFKHRRGRMAFRLAARIMSLSARYDRNQILDRIWQNVYCVPELEPDLMQTSAEVLFLDGAKTEEPALRAKLANNLIRESLALSELRQLQRQSPRRAGKWAEELIKRIGYEPTEGFAESLSIIYWQATVWQLAAGCDSETAALKLSRYWVPMKRLPVRIELSANANREDRDQWKSQIETLLDLRGEKRSIVIRRDELMIPDYGWVLYSPWLGMTLRTPDAGHSSSSQYPSAVPRVTDQSVAKGPPPTSDSQSPSQRDASAPTKVPVLIRLIVSALVSIRILQRSKGQNTDGVFASTIAHASYVLSSYEKWLTRHDKIDDELRKDIEDGKVATLKPAMTGLALWGRAQIERAGRGTIDSIPPEIFLDILRRSRARRGGSQTPRHESDEAEFCRTVLPEVLISWIMSAYTGAAEESGAARWIEHIPEVYRFFKQVRHTENSQRRAAIVLRFLSPGNEGHPDYASLNWTKLKTKGWRFNHQMILLTERLSADEWVQSQRSTNHLSDPKKWFLTRIAIANERLASLDNGGTREYETKWRNEWRDCLNSVIRKDQLYRFTRLRLVEMLGAPILSNEPEDQELIALLLLEYGVYYELKRMFDAIYFPESEDGVNEVRRELRRNLLQAIYRDIEITAQEQEKRINPEDPRITQIYINKSIFLEGLLARIAYLSGTSNAEGGRDLYESLVTLHRRALNRRVRAKSRTVSALVEQRGQKRAVVLARQDRWVEGWMVRAAAFDPNTSYATLLVDDLDKNGAVNLFDKSSAEVQEFLAGCVEKAKFVLAVVVEVQGRGPVRDYTFNYGNGEHLKASWREGTVFNRGSYVRIPIQQPVNGRPKIADLELIEELSSRMAPGDIATIVVSEVWVQPRRSHIKKRKLELTLGKKSITDRADLEIWDADLSRNFREQTEARPVYVKAELTSDGRWLPVSLSLTELILEAFAGKDFAVLTFISHSRDEFYEDAWLFSTRPGHNYSLARTDFSDKDAETIKRKIGNLKDPRGLLVVVTPEIHRDALRLRLVEEVTPSNPVDRVYQDLKAPFDDRNLRWRGAFEVGDTELAYQEMGVWKVDDERAKVPMSPSAVPVTRWEDDDEPRNVSKVLMTVSRWNPRDGTLLGDYVKTHKVSPSQGDYQGFLERWSAIGRGTRVRLRIVRGNITDRGTISCETSEAIIIPVEAESLSMQALDPENRFVIDREREAEIVTANWRREDLIRELQVDSFPDQSTNRDYCEGIFIEVPRDPDEPSFQVLWNVDGKAQPDTLTIDKKIARVIRLGWKIKGTRSGEVWRWEIERPIISARALWTVTEKPQQYAKSVYYLGTIRHKGRDVAVAQVRPGELVVLPRLIDAPHLSLGSEDRFSGGLKTDLETRNVAAGRSWTRDRIEYRRALLEVDDGRLLTGNCRADTDTFDSLLLRSVTLRSFSREDGYCALERVFRLLQIRKPKPLVREPEREKGAEHWKKWLSDYLEVSDQNSDKVLKADIQREGQYVVLKEHQIPDDRSRTGSTSTITVHPNEREFMQALFVKFPTVRKDRQQADGLVILFRDSNDQKIYASFSRVPPQTPYQYMSELSVTYDERVSLINPLYYIGYIEEGMSDTVRGGEYKERHHRFEYGYGKTMQAPESKLRYAGGSFSNALYVINIGDKIKGVTFLRDQPDQPDSITSDDDESGSAQGCIIAIDDVGMNLIEHSQATSLYNQRKKHQIIHVLHVIVYPEDKVTVEYVEGYDPDSEEPTKSFSRIRAELSEDSKKRLQESLSFRRHDSPEPARRLTILGRLNVDEFERIHGGRVLFEHVRFSFDASVDGPPLESGELVFVRATEIRRIPNDMVLCVAPLKTLDDLDIGDDMKSPIWIFRREFSVRENSLERLDNSEQIVENGVFLVELKKRQVEDEKKAQQAGAKASLIESPPLRTPSVLRGAVRQGEGGLFLATVGGVYKRIIRIELSPGVFTELGPDQIAERPSALSKGAIVKIEIAENNGANVKKAPDKFRLSLAAYGDERYVPEKMRLAVVLPKNYLIFMREPDRRYHIQSSAWLDRRDRMIGSDSFTVGGLPNLSPRPASFDRGSYTWHPPVARDCLDLMATPHPKIAWIGKKDGISRLTLATGDQPVGSLERAPEGVKVSFAPLRNDLLNPGGKLGDWPILSFADEPVLRVIERIDREKWRFHDTLTATWGNGEPDKKDVPETDAWNGPLFFERRTGVLRLRYSRSEFLRYGFPVEQLFLSLLRKKGRAVSYPVAGASAESLWIEVVPGRIVEIPVQLIVWRPKGEREKSLAAFHWEGFAPGDRVTLVASNNPLLVDRIVLREWEAGPRGAFGPGYAVLPVQGHNVQEGGITLGAGAYTLTLPVSSPNTGWRVASLNLDNKIEDSTNRWPEEGAVVLLGLNDSGDPVVLGFDEFRPVPSSRPDIWQDDPLAGYFVSTRDGQTIANQRGLRTLISVAGKALPVTVERIVNSKSADGSAPLIFSRMHQCGGSSLPPGSLSLARMAGLLPDGHTALLRCGAGLIAIPMSKVVSGLPREFFNTTAQSLSASKRLIWLRGVEDGEVETGFYRSLDAHTHTPARALRVISLETETPPRAGLICSAADSAGLHWLGAEKAAWTELTPDQLRSVFLKNSRGLFNATRESSGDLSIVDMPDVRKEFKSYQIGKQLAVSVIAEINDENVKDETATGVRHYLVASRTSNVVMKCELYDDVYQEGETHTVEVAWRSVSPYSITVNAMGKRRQMLDLPVWMLESFGRDVERRERFRNYLQWRAEQLDPSARRANLPDLDGDGLERLLCQALRSEDVYDGLKVEIAKEWWRRKRNQSPPELDVQYAIIAILILHSIGNKRKDPRLQLFAREICQDLGSRAVRSLHLEILYRKWLASPSNRSAEYPLWTRLRQVAQDLNTQLTAENIRAIRQLRRGVVLRNVSNKSAPYLRDILPIAEALSMAAGQLSISVVDYAPEREVWITKELVAIHRILPLASSPQFEPLEETHIKRLGELLETINLYGLDITLLQGLSTLDYLD